MVAYRCVSGCTDSGLVDSVARARLQRKGQEDQDIKAAVLVGKDRYPELLLQGIDKAIMINEEDRPQSVADWIPQLFGAQAQPQVQVSEVATRVINRPAAASGQSVPGPGQPRSRKFPLWIAAAAVVLVVGGLAASMLFKTESDDTIEEPPVVATAPAQPAPVPESPPVVERAPQAVAPEPVPEAPPQPATPRRAALDPEDEILKGLDVDEATRASRKQNITGVMASYIQVKTKFASCVENGCAQMMSLKAKLDNVRQVNWRSGDYTGVLRLGRSVSKNNPDCRWSVDVYERLEFSTGAREQNRVYCTSNGISRRLASAESVRTL
jgi:hypothetical protein